MTFEETVAFLREQEGRRIEVSIFLPAGSGYDPDEAFGRSVASFEGGVTGVKPRSGPETDAWSVWLNEDFGGCLVLSPERFEGAEATAHQPPAEERSDTGDWWSLVIRQADLVFDVVIYV